MSSTSDNGKKRKNGRVYIFLFILVAITVGATAWWYKIYTSYISTDDAYIEADRVAVGAKILGQIVKLHVDEGDTVRAGELLAELDSAELKARLEQSYAMESQMEANIAQAKAKYQMDQKSIEIQQINLKTSKDDYDRAVKQHDGGVITEESFEHTRKNYKTAQAQFETAQQSVKVSHAQVATAEASLSNTEAQIKLIETQLANTRIYSPVDGIVAKKWLLEGDITSPGQPIVTVTSTGLKWVTAYIEETKLNEISLNQAAEFTVDAFPGLTFHGKVYYIGANTAGQFSLIPPNNASGNFTKVTQRVPLKISYDSVEGARRSDVKLVSGMSVILKILK